MDIKDLTPNQKEFIGWKSEDGLLEVVGVSHKVKTTTYFKVVCSECSKDLELFPDGYFVSTKAKLLEGKKPCCCSHMKKWEPFQYLIRANREAVGYRVVEFHGDFKGIESKVVCEDDNGFQWVANLHNVVKKGGLSYPSCIKYLDHTLEGLIGDITKSCEITGFIFKGIVGEFSGATTKIIISCPIHGEFTTNYNRYVTRGDGCRKCGNVKTGDSKRNQLALVESKSKLKCEEYGYEYIGFLNGYINQSSKVFYNCHLHGEQYSTYVHFAGGFSKCKQCAHEARVKSTTLPLEEVLRRCNERCKDKDYTPIGFKEGYTNFLSKFYYICPEHGEISQTYQDFYIGKYGCIYCGRKKAIKTRRENNNVYNTDTYTNFGLYTEMLDRLDYLYVFKLDSKIKVGRSFDVYRRFKEVIKHFNIADGEILTVWKGKHAEVYTTEQHIHAKLTEWGFWDEGEIFSQEIFDAESSNLIYSLIHESNLVLE